MELNEFDGKSFAYLSVQPPDGVVRAKASFRKLKETARKTQFVFTLQVHSIPIVGDQS